MPRTPANLPQRTPPARPEGAIPGRALTSVSPVVSPPPVGFTLAAGTERLQAHLDRLATEFDRLKIQLRQAQKLAGIGTNAAMIAHEFNNLFTPVVAYAQYALDSGDVELMRKALTKTIERSATMRNMADRLIGLAKQSNDAIKAIRVLEIAQAAVESLGRDPERDNIVVKLQIDPELTVRASESGLLQVLFNLVINARQAMLDRGRGRLTLDAAPTTDNEIDINVRDTGCGIPPENLSRIFEPFFSTKQDAAKPDKRGLGLGLSICRDIIEELGGRLTVTSEVNVGTTFTITLPRAD